MPHDPALAIPAECLWTVRDAAAFLRLGRNAIYEMAKRDELPSIRIGSRVRFDPAALRVWLRQKHDAPASMVPIGLKR